MILRVFRSCLHRWLAVPFLIGLLCPSSRADQFLLEGGFYDPPPATQTSTQYQMVKTAHYTGLMRLGYQSPNLAFNATQLSLSAQNGLKSYIMDSRLADMVMGYAAFNTATLDQIISDYSSYPGFQGLYIWDEPDESKFPVLGQINQYLQQHDPTHVPLINILPNYAGTSQLGASTYDQYVTDFISIVKPSALLCDFYPLLTTGESQSYFQNLETLRTHAQQAGIPLMLWTQTEQFSSGVREPTQNDLNWEAYTLLNYGVHGIIDFYYWTSQSTNYPAPAIIDVNGNQTPAYGWITTLNQRITNLLPTYMQLQVSDVIHSAPFPSGTHGLQANSPMTTFSTDMGQGAVATWFKDNSQNSYLLVTNRSTQFTQTVTLTLNSSFVGYQQFNQTTGAWQSAVQNTTLSIPSMSPGDGELFRLNTSAVSPAAVTINPTGFIFSALQGQTNPQGQTLNISNSPAANSNLNWSVTTNASWLTASRNFVTPTSGSEAPGGTATPPVTVSVNIAGLAASSYNGIITLITNDPNHPTIAIPVGLTVNPAASLGCIPSGDETGINSALIGAGASAILCPNAVFNLNASVLFSADNQKLYTLGLPSGTTRAVLRLSNPAITVAINARNVNNAEIRNIIVDGNRAILGASTGDALISTGGNGTGVIVDHIQAGNTRSWSTLLVDQGACTNGTITNNTIGPAGVPYPVGPWADGISMACANTTVANNTVTDATDGAIVVFCAPGSHVTGNTILAQTNSLLGGINMVDYQIGDYNGNYTGTIVDRNLINAASARIETGIAMGQLVWACGSMSWPAGTPNYGGTVTNNTLTGNYFGYGYVASNVSQWTVTGNVSTAVHSGSPGLGCGTGDSTPAAFIMNGATSSGAFQPEFGESTVENVLNSQATNPVYAAQIVSQSVPATMTPGQTAGVTITVKNVGTVTWTQASNYKLGSQRPQDNSTWGNGRATLNPTDSIGPGQTKTFSFAITAPQTSQTYNFQWRMLQEGVKWFGDFTPNISISVSGTPPAPLLSAAPNTLTFTANASGSNPNPQTISLTNTGNATSNWSATTDASWLLVTPGSGSLLPAGNQTEGVSVVTGSLAAGPHVGHLTFTDQAGIPVVVTVTFTVSGATPPAAVSINPSAFTFTAVQGQTNPQAQILNISNTAPAGSSNLNWSVTTNFSWLTANRNFVTPTSGSEAPGGTSTPPITVAVNIAGLSPNTYNGQVTLMTNDPNHPTIAIPVTFSITAPQTPVLSASLSSLSFSAPQGGANPLSQNVTLSNSGNATSNWSLISDAAWLLASPGSGSLASLGSQPISVSVVTGSLAAGPHVGHLTFTDQAGIPVIVIVTFMINAPQLSVSPVALSFSATPAGGSPASQTITISNTGAADAQWTATSDAAWLSVSPANGTSLAISGSQLLSVSVSIGSLGTGTYTGHLTFTDQTGIPHVVTITFTVPAPHLGVSPSALSFAAMESGNSPAPQTLQITNTGGADSHWSASSDAPWLAVSPASGGSLALTGSQLLSVTATTGLLPASLYTGHLTFTDQSAVPIVITITFTVSPRAPAITQQPTDQTVRLGQTATFTAAASGTAPLSFQWFKVGSATPVGTGTTYTTPITTLGDDGSQFYVVVSNVTGQPATSTSATLHVNPLPTVTAPNLSPNGGAFTGSVQVTLTDATSGAQMYYTTDGTAPSSAATLYAAPFTLTTNTTVRAIAQKAGMNTSSESSAQFTINQVPVITQQPTDETVTVGQSGLFKVAATGTDPLSYQWNKNGQPILGETGSTYTTPVVALTDEGTTYSVVITNVTGIPATSRPAVLHVSALPTVTAPSLSPSGGTFTGSVVVTLTNATLGTQMFYTTDGSAPSTGSTLYTAPLTLSVTATVRAIAAKSGFTNSSETSASFTINQAPLITQQPANQTVTLGQPATFAAAANGTLPLAFQWFKVGSPNAVGTGTTYTTPATVLSDEGSQFYVVVSNVTNQPATSPSATLHVNPLPTVATPSITPPGGTFLGSVQVALTDVTPGAHIHFTIDGSAPSSGSALYQSPITLTQNATVRAIADLVGMTTSAEVQAPFTITIAVPDVSGLNGKTFTPQDTLTLNPSAFASGYHWQFEKTSDHSALASIGAQAVLGSPSSVETPAPQLRLGDFPLSTGFYSVRVQAISGNQVSAWSAPATFALVESDLRTVHVFPNPWRSARGDGGITFDQLAAGSTVKIFTVSGHWVKTLTAPVGTASWDVKTDSGEMAAAGIYLYLITDTEGHKTRGKFVIIR